VLGGRRAASWVGTRDDGAAAVAHAETCNAERVWGVPRARTA